MKAKRSPLNLHDIFVLQSHFEVNEPPRTEELDIEELLNSYEIDIDFGLRFQDGIDILATKIGINVAKKLPGYTIVIECLGYFTTAGEAGKKTRSSLVINNVLSLNIGFIRNFIASQTSFGPLGKYWLPTINASDLVNEKIALQKSLATKKVPKKKTNTK